MVRRRGLLSTVPIQEPQLPPSAPGTALGFQESLQGGAPLRLPPVPGELTEDELSLLEAGITPPDIGGLNQPSAYGGYDYSLAGLSGVRGLLGGDLGDLGDLGVGGLGGLPTSPGGPTPYSGPTSFQPIRTGRIQIVDRTPEGLPSPRDAAPEIQRAWFELQARWPNTTNMGSYVVRNIAGTDTLSQHSFGDALDIGGDDQQLTEQASWLANHAGELGITEVIFKDAIWTTSEGWHPYTRGGHETHVHITGPQTYTDTTPDFPVVRWDRPTPGTRSTRSTTGAERQLRRAPSLPAMTPAVRQYLRRQ